MAPSAPLPLPPPAPLTAFLGGDGTVHPTNGHNELQETPPVETPPPKLPGKSNLKRRSMFGSPPPSRQLSGPPQLSQRFSDCVDNMISNDMQSADGPKSGSGNGTDDDVVLDADLEEYKRKDSRVTWTDSHGRNLAEVWEFEPSDTGDSDEESDSDSSQACTCVIQ